MTARSEARDGQRNRHGPLFSTKEVAMFRGLAFALLAIVGCP